MADFVLDASAILAFFLDEAGGDIVADALTDASVCVVNLTEVVARLSDKGLSVNSITEQIEALPVIIHPADEALAFAAGFLRAQTRHLGLSLGDRFCLALAGRLKCPILTADKAWTELDIGLDIRVIR